MVRMEDVYDEEGTSGWERKEDNLLIHCSFDFPDLQEKNGGVLVKRDRNGEFIIDKRDRGWFHWKSGFTSKEQQEIKHAIDSARKSLTKTQSGQTKQEKKTGLSLLTPQIKKREILVTVTIGSLLFLTFFFFRKYKGKEKAQKNKN
jgi:hypothetical protein